MLRPDIQARENRKTLDLLGFALRRAGVDQRAWQIAASFDALAACDDCVCLYAADGVWVVAYTERGQWRETGRFQNTSDASKFFYAQFLPGPSPYDVRNEWETATGQQFSMMD
ncbi:MAG: hypothetical protein J0J06_14200 [Sphingomonas sp.]|uniref:hypothetical protein n=1 Tax=Sphingomonas sp. TaxID=28214 RepID=UPI001AC4A638|nr:hypothetical protein [Sphingomonas sp.]MBN8816584.1 hypothetical protein [Sphingomonas sp.]